MNKNEFDSFDNIKVPDEIDMYIKNGLKKAKRDEKKKKSRFLKIALCISIIIILTTSFDMNSLAYKIPFIKDVYKELRHSEKADTITTNFNTYFEECSQKINQTVKANGKSVTAESVLCDGKDIAVSYIIKSDEKFDIDDTKTQLRSDCVVKINNSDDYEFNSLGIEGDYVDEYTFVGTELLRLENKNSLPDKFDMNIVFRNIDGEFYDKPANYMPPNAWKFEFEVKSDTSNNKIINVDESKGKFTLSSIEVRTLTLIINDIIPNDSKETAYDIEVYDDKGNIIDKLESMEVEYYDTKSKITTTYKAIDKDCKYIKVVYKQLEVKPNLSAPGYILCEKDDVEDVVFKIDIK